MSDHTPVVPHHETAPLTASSECPVCGVDTPHSHTQEHLADWLRHKGATYGFTGRVLPPLAKDDSIFDDVVNFCEQHPYAHGTGYALIYRMRSYLEQFEGPARRYSVPATMQTLQTIRELVRSNSYQKDIDGGFKSLIDICDQLEAALASPLAEGGETPK